MGFTGDTLQTINQVRGVEARARQREMLTRFSVQLREAYARNGRRIACPSADGRHQRFEL
jgi:hypothetical protein